ncbi:hypothetical protein FB45DRAFT_1041191 [Roridomyces roridus]|uniref:Uncharacterized protein n=1 Tax=Roridomyces roridus TaxID=1738132 RepID=A0AAD7F742_9AGAR|nr:hypothetical protein FB45DRAFT_1041191 [Roridomyces roridus]
MSVHLQPLVGMTSDMFPVLETLVLNVDDYYRGPPDEQAGGIIDAFRTAPLLTSVDLSGLNQLVSEDRLQWSQLTELHLRTKHMQKLRQIIRLCGQLETCNVWRSDNALCNREDVPHCALPKLSYIALTSFDVGWFLKALSFPGLRRISLRGHGEIQGLVELYDRAPFELDALELSGHSPPSYKAQELVPLFRRTTNLGTLRLHRGILADRDLWAVLTYSKEHGTLLPNLEELTVSEHDLKHISTFAAMLESRWWPQDSEFEESNANNFRPMARIKRVAVDGEWVGDLRTRLHDALGCPSV